MGGHWVRCGCGGWTRFPKDTMWIDENYVLHDTRRWLCGECGRTLKAAEWCGGGIA